MREEVSVPRRFGVVVVTAVALAGFAACGGHPPPQPDGDVARGTLPTAPRPSPKNDDQTAVAQAYARFWQATRGAGQLALPEREKAVTAVAAGPLRGQILRRLQQQHSQGISLYGHIATHVSQVDVRGDQATVFDCQDASQAGQTDASGKRRTAGLAANAVHSGLERGADGQWRVVRVEYRGGGC